MRKHKVKNQSYLTSTRKQLRNNGTPAEAALWSFLKSSQLDGRKFRRQASIENYIVDFFCPAERLIIELDGAVHAHTTVAENDKYRDERLQDLGYTVLRFENKDVFQLTDWILDEVRKHFK